MIDKVEMYYQSHGCESCVATLVVEKDGHSFTRTLDFSGNAISGVLFGAVSVVNAIQEIMGMEPQGYVNRTPTRLKRGRQIAAYRKINPDAFRNGHLTDHDAFNAWLNGE